MKKKLFVAALQIGLWLGIAPAMYSQVPLEERLKKHVYTLADDSLMGRKAGSESSRKAAEYIIAQWKEIGIPPLNGASYLSPFMQQYRNLLGIIEGNDPLLKDEYIVIGAHYDHLGFKVVAGDTVVYNGADDNASGVATIIELGRKLKEIQPALRRSIILAAFDAEEIGLYGSTDFAGNPPFPIEKVKLMFSVDMVGWYKKSGYVKYAGTGTIKNGKHLLLDKRFIPEGLHIETQNFERSIFTATDTEGFAKKGVPTLSVSTGLKSPYHKPEDDAGLIDYNGMALITEHLANLVQAVSQDEDYQASGRFASKHKTKQLVFGVSANLGTNFHFYTAGELDGKPADAYGIGFTARMNMGYLALRPEVYYDFIQARHPAGKVSTHSVTIPVNLLLQTPPSSTVGAAVFAGPYFSYKFSGRQGGSSLDFTNVFNRREAGINYGLDLRLSQIRLGITRRDALTNFSRVKNPDGAHIRNSAIYATLSYEF